MVGKAAVGTDTRVGRERGESRVDVTVAGSASGSADFADLPLAESSSAGGAMRRSESSKPFSRISWELE